MQFINSNNITDKSDLNYKFKSLSSNEYKTMAVQYAEIDLPNNLLADKTQFFNLLRDRFLINKYGPEDFDKNQVKYTSEFLYYLNKPLATTKGDKKSQLRLGLFNEEGGIKIIIPTNSEGSLPKSMIAANYGIKPTNKIDPVLVDDPDEVLFAKVIQDGKNNPGLLWTGLNDGITEHNYKYTLDQVEYSAGKAIANIFKDNFTLFGDELCKLNAALFNDKALLTDDIQVSPSPFLAQIANVRYKKYEKEVIVPELLQFAPKNYSMDISPFIANDGSFKAGDNNLNYQELHLVQAEYIAYMYNDLDSTPLSTEAIKKKALHIHNMTQSMQMFGDANTRLARTLYYAYLFKHNMNPGTSFKDFSPIMGDSPIFKANLKMLDVSSEDKVITFMLNSFSKSQPSFSLDNFVNETVVKNIGNIL